MLHKTRNTLRQATMSGLSIMVLGLAACGGNTKQGSSSAPQTVASSNLSVASSSALNSSIASASMISSSSSLSLPSSSSSMASSSSQASGPMTYAPNDTRIRYNGRVSVTSTAALYDWANTQIEFRVNAAQIELLFNDGKNDYNVFVDGQLQSTLSTTAGSQAYPVSLGAGEHHVLVTKRTGPNFGSGQFLGVNLPQGGDLLARPAAPVRKIEFIGDSYTVGYGNEGTGLDCGGVYRPYENSYLSYAPIAARALGAQSHSIAISGHGAVRNYGDANTTSPTPVPFFYNRAVMGRSDLQWDFSRWIPDAVVIKLGTNDHSTQPEPPADVFIEGVHGLIGQINDAYGQLPIFLLSDSSLPQVIQRMQSAAQQQNNMGNSQVQFVQVTHPALTQLGCDYHPLVVGHQAMANELVAAIKPVLGWNAPPASGGASSTGSNPSGNAQFDTIEVTPFKGDAKGAYSMILDDYCANFVSGIDDYAIPALLENGLRAGLGALVSECQNNNYQARLKEVHDLGFEIVNHTWSHPALVECATNPNQFQACSDVRPDFSVEIDQARAFLEQAIGAPVNFFIFPFNAVDDVTLNHLRAQGYLGARGGGYTTNAANFSDPFKLNLLGNQADMNALADQAVSSGSFSLINLHGIADASYQPVPLDTWNNHVVYLKSLVDKHDLWVDNPTAIVKYNRAKALCGTPQLSGSTLNFSGAQTGCDNYATGLTIKVSANAGVADLAPMQQGVLLTTRRVSANVVLIEGVDPRYSTTLN